MHRLLCLVLVACGASSVDEDPEYYEAEMPCDPFMEDVEVEIEREPAPVCGDGRATSQRTRCSRACSVGCGTDGMCEPIECEYVRERCDGEEIAVRSDTGERWHCGDNGYLPGPAVCTADCQIDWSRCAVCQPREGLECASADLDAGRGQPMLLELGRRVAVIVRHASSGDLVGGFVDAQLRFRAWNRPLAVSTKAAVLYDGDVAFVADDGSLRLVDVLRRRVVSLADAPTDDMGGFVMLMPEHQGTGIALAWEWLHSTDLRFAVFERDGTSATFETPRYFRSDDQRLIVGQLREARDVNSIELQSGTLVAVAARTGSMGVVSNDRGTFRFHGGIDHADLGHASIRAQWREGAGFDQVHIEGEDLAQQFRIPRVQRPEAEGLAPVATAGARWIDAFGGVLIANTVVSPDALGLYLVATP